VDKWVQYIVVEHVVVMDVIFEFNYKLLYTKTILSGDVVSAKHNCINNEKKLIKIGNISHSINSSKRVKYFKILPYMENCNFNNWRKLYVSRSIRLWITTKYKKLIDENPITYTF